MLRYLLVMHGSGLHSQFPQSDCAELEVLDRFARVSPEPVAKPSADLSFLAAADATFPFAAPRRGAAGTAAPAIEVAEDRAAIRAARAEDEKWDALAARQAASGASSSASRVLMKEIRALQKLQ